MVSLPAEKKNKSILVRSFISFSYVKRFKLHIQSR